MKVIGKPERTNKRHWKDDKAKKRAAKIVSLKMAVTMGPVVLVEYELKRQPY